MQQRRPVGSKCSAGRAAQATLPELLTRVVPYSMFATPPASIGTAALPELPVWIVLPIY